MARNEIAFEKLETADLIVDALYKGGMFQDIRDDPLSKLMGCGNQGGFRIVVGVSSKPLLVILYSSLNDPDWPDNIDAQTGIFTYYGDNKSPGHELHATPRKGNELLRTCFGFLGSATGRLNIPPFFIFTKGTHGRDVIFRGLAVPGSPSLSPTENLVAVWKTKAGERFQNYRAYFTILAVPKIARNWITDILNNQPLSQNCPDAWNRWVKFGQYEVLKSEPTVTYRNKIGQMPSNAINKELVNILYQYFREDPFKFEHCAAKIAQLMDPNIVSYDVTRPWRDGGRDAIGFYRIGSLGDNIKVEFALEAKCFKPDKGVGIKHTSRLISRLKHRQFGIFVTTSYIGEQAYREIREDGHPVIIVAADDIAKILTNAGIGTPEKLTDWLKSNFP